MTDLLDVLTYRTAVIGGGTFHVWSDGTVLPAVRGGDGPDDDDDGEGDADGDDKGDADDDAGDDDKADDKADDKPLGPKGERALQAEKTRRRAAQAELREWKALGLTAAEAKKRLADRNGDDDQPTPEQIREQAKAEAKAEGLRDRVLDKIEAKAGARFSLDPEDVAALLMRRHDVDDFLDDGKIDTEAISEALDELLEKRPNLAAQGGRRFKGNGDGGTRKETGPSQLTRADLARMTPQAIEKARKDGQLVDLLSGKT